MHQPSSLNNTAAGSMAKFRVRVSALTGHPGNSCLLLCMGLLDLLHTEKAGAITINIQIREVCLVFRIWCSHKCHTAEYSVIFTPLAKLFSPCITCIDCIWKLRKRKRQKNRYLNARKLPAAITERPLLQMQMASPYWKGTRTVSSLAVSADEALLV